MPNPFAAWGAAEAVTLIAATIGSPKISRDMVEVASNGDIGSLRS